MGPPIDSGDLAVVTPSFRGDAELFADLHESVLANTAPRVVHHVVVPPSDAHLFEPYRGARCRVWTHRDLLPWHCVSVPHASGLTLNLRRPWLPVRGWVVQQLMKLAASAALDARAVLVVDSDAVLLREPTLDEVTHDGRPWHFRRDGGVTGGMHRHLKWHKVARELLDVPGSVAAPAPDYVSPIAVWYPAVVRAMMAHIEESTGRNWLDAIAGKLHVSEFVLYGVFADHVLSGTARFDGPLCHNYYERVPLRRADVPAFADQMPSSALGAMISSHSRTRQDVRRETFRRCAEIVGGAWRPAREPGAEPTSPRASRESRASRELRCLDAALWLAQISAAGPAALC